MNPKLADIHQRIMSRRPLRSAFRVLDVFLERNIGVPFQVSFSLRSKYTNMTIDRVQLLLGYNWKLITGRFIGKKYGGP